jgi:hypothetical protein
MMVAIHNPSNIAIETVEVKVPHGKYTVQKYLNNGFVEAEADTICYIQP